MTPFAKPFLWTRLEEVLKNIISSTIGYLFLEFSKLYPLFPCGLPEDSFLKSSFLIQPAKSKISTQNQQKAEKSSEKFTTLEIGKLPN
jgi:hypothetical protein